MNSWHLRKSSSERQEEFSLEFRWIGRQLLWTHIYVSILSKSLEGRLKVWEAVCQTAASKISQLLTLTSCRLLKQQQHLSKSHFDFNFNFTQQEASNLQYFIWDLNAQTPVAMQMIPVWVAHEFNWCSFCTTLVKFSIALFIARISSSIPVSPSSSFEGWPSPARPLYST